MKTVANPVSTPMWHTTATRQPGYTSRFSAEGGGVSAVGTCMMAGGYRDRNSALIIRAADDAAQPLSVGPFSQPFGRLGGGEACAVFDGRHAILPTVLSG